MTKHTRTLILVAISLSAACAAAQTDAEKAFAAIKNMPGTWEGTSIEGPVKVTFKVTGGGSSVMSEILGKEDMISMINMDGTAPTHITPHSLLGTPEPLYGNGDAARTRHRLH